MRTNKVFIRQPIWGQKAVGIAETKLADVTLIEIVYKDRSGNRVFPATYSIKLEKAMTYPIQMIKKVSLRIIPIKDLDEI